MTYLNQYAFFLNKFIPQLSTCVPHHSLLIIITIMRQSKNEVQYNDCIFCEEDAGDSIFFMMNDAIKVKYIENPKESTTSYIDALLRIEAPTNKEEAEAGCMFRQWLVLDDHDEFLKREYKRQEYANKIAQLSQYYKFHNGIPRVVEYGVQKIMGRHYDKKRECDYKRIKKVLKAQQGLSITSVQESSSGFSDSQIVKKSKYSTLLNAISHSNINEHSDSKVLYQLCKEIDKAIPQEKAQPFSVKGSFPEDRMFEYYLKSEQKKLKDRLRERNKVRQGSKVLKKFNYQEFLKSREKATDESKETKQKEEKKSEKEGRFIYNTNVKIEIRNAMFYSQGQNALQIGNFENEFNSKDNRFKKKSAAGKINTNPYRSNQKIAAQIYKSSQHDLRLRNHLAMATQKTTTKENVNISRSKQKRKSTSKQLQPDMKKGLHTLSARKLLHGNEWVLTSKPGRSLSTSSIKKRSTSTGVVGSTSTKKLEQRPIERKAIEGISRYGSSQYKPIINLGKDSKSVSIKELLSRKLKFNI